jgi:hypothetical protein
MFGVGVLGGMALRHRKEQFTATAPRHDLLDDLKQKWRSRLLIFATWHRSSGCI